MNFTANGLLAFGGSPIMAKETTEICDMVANVDGVLINIGTLTTLDQQAMMLAGKSANEHGIPVVLDPVGVAATTFRASTVERLLSQVNFTAIKGNAGEMAHLIGMTLETKGVESADTEEAVLITIARKVADKYDTIAIVTGETDVICKDNQIKLNKTGHPLLTNITGAGCLLGSLITAGLTTDMDPLNAVYDVVSFYGRAAERALEHPSINGTGTFLPHFIDQLGAAHSF